MLGLYILECYVHIIPDHIKGSVPKDFLEAENISSVHKPVFSKRMPKNMS